ncbi:hypothetical protein BDZ85DRAFT_279665 [Elsinoe ampelina]|uniref:Uncharacterized protein n=1 Tax=Elsinoe ampelina TaxID=302913 RepID=A0A6A6GJV0_9PEZI|nr:hypothetical protein BDZ85DRAFT_279665 [Elsinoe ampelina]
MAKKIKFPAGYSSSTKKTLREALKKPKPTYTPQQSEEHLRWAGDDWSGMSNKERQFYRSMWYRWHAQDDPLKGREARQANAEHERARRQRDAANRRAHREAAHKAREITWIERERLAVERAERIAATYSIEGLEAVEHYESETADGDDTGAEQDDQDLRWMELFIYENAPIEENLGQGQEGR